uniref:Kinesin motor domain-containing protein n=1 Tax=Cucumis melo TaxID=3656 RepID=A0A9I9E1B9_CUCME
MASSTSLSRSQRSSTISPFRSRKSSGLLPASSPNGRPTTPSSMASSRPPSKVLISPMTTASCNPSPSTPPLDCFDVLKAKENVTVTVRFRPLRNGGPILAEADKFVVFELVMVLGSLFYFFSLLVFDLEQW